MNNDIKVIAFDFDGTLYSGTNPNFWKEFCDNWFKNYFKDLPNDEFNKIYEAFTKKGKSDEALIETLIERNIDVNVWLDYRKANPCKKDYENATIVSNALLNNLAKKYRLYIISNSIIQDIERHSKNMNIDLSVFKNIVINEYKNKVTSKEYLIEEVIKQKNIKPSELLMVGDSLNSDIKPALNVGAKGCLVKNASFTIKDLGIE